MQYENKILNFHIYLYFPSNIFKKFKNIKIENGTHTPINDIIVIIYVLSFS